jgi:4-hydroxy-4-methyl-2-oxoglutarate aldolase
MEKHALHGVVNREIRRPDRSLIEGFSGFTPALVSDAMGRQGAMNSAIAPIDRNFRLLGPAITVLTRPGDPTFIMYAAELAAPGDVLVIDAGATADLAVVGERIGYYFFEKRGIAGAVVDGAVRDVSGLRRLGRPVFARGISVRLIGMGGPGAVNVPISCGGVTVNPGDLVIGDDDGVVVVPHDDLERVQALAKEHLDGELSRQAQVNEGKSLLEIRGLEGLVSVWQ